MSKPRSSGFGLRETLFISFSVSILTIFVCNQFEIFRSDFRFLQTPLLTSYSSLAAPTDKIHLRSETHHNFSKRLIFYNRPPKTASTSVRIAMSRALRNAGLVPAKCFNRIEWNQMALRTIINRRSIDFYGCHTILTQERFADISIMRGGNVTFMTSTRPSERIIFSAYMQIHRDRNLAEMTNSEEIDAEVERYKQFVNEYPVGALYNFHGAEHPLNSCPVTYAHEEAMRRVAERYEIVVDLSRPEESAALVEIVTGLKPNFSLAFNQRTTARTRLIRTLENVDVSHKLCGNELVHKVLSQQFNLIKDRLMQNRCFNENSGTFEQCDKASLSANNIQDRSREESFKARRSLENMSV